MGVNESDFSKPVLLVFWATLCKPCLEELPIIKQIRNSYNEQSLEIIFVSYESDITSWKNMIRDKQLNWINIYNDVDIINAYGGYRAIPRVYLIDSSGHIAYSKEADDRDDPQLTNLKKYLADNVAK